LCWKSILDLGSQIDLLLAHFIKLVWLAHFIKPSLCQNSGAKLKKIISFLYIHWESNCLDDKFYLLNTLDTFDFTRFFMYIYL
jgi:hypothetical protein